MKLEETVCHQPLSSWMGSTMKLWSAEWWQTFFPCPSVEWWNIIFVWLHMVSNHCTCDRSLCSHLVHTVLHCVTLSYTVLCRITNGPFDQEVISSPLTLEDPDLKVSLVPSSDFISEIGSDPTHLMWQEKSLKTPDPPLAQTIYWEDMTCSHYHGLSFFVQAILVSSTTRKNKKKKKKVCMTILVCMCDCPGVYLCGCGQRGSIVGCVWEVCVWQRMWGSVNVYWVLPLHHCVCVVSTWCGFTFERQVSAGLNVAVC